MQEDQNMGSSLSGEELKKLGFSMVDRELFFVLDHPEFKNFTPYLRGTYTACRANELKGRIPELEEAYDHVFVTNGGCTWCKIHYESLRGPLSKLLQE